MSTERELYMPTNADWENQAFLDAYHSVRAQLDDYIAAAPNDGESRTVLIVWPDIPDELKRKVMAALDEEINGEPC